MENSLAKSSSGGNEGKEEEELYKPWSGLPSEIPSIILSHLFGPDYRTFSVICKDWQSITPTPIRLFGRMHTFNDFMHSQIPLLFFEGCNDTYNLFHPIYNKIYQMDMPELLGSKMRYSKNGWLLMTRNNLSAFFFNPMTNSEVILPRMPTEYLTMSFSSEPISPNCLVVGMNLDLGQVGVLRRGEEDWTTFDLEIPKSFDASLCSPILYEGKCYCLATNGIGVFCPEDDSEAFKFWPMIRKKKLEQTCFMLMDNKDVFAVSTPLGREKIRVLKWDNSQDNWQIIKNLGNKMMFVSDGGSFLESIEVRGLSNKIYFPTFENKNGVFYSLKTWKYHSFYDNFSCEGPFNMDKPLNSIWIKPSNVKVDDEFEWSESSSSSMNIAGIFVD